MRKSKQDGASETFQKAIERAEYILTLANGLTDHRKRSARSDWTGPFKTLMHWPQRYNIDRVDSKDVILVIRDNSNLEREDFSTEKLDDLLRAALVMAVSAMDAYFHAKVLQYVVKRSKQVTVPARLLNHRILVSDFIVGTKKERSNSALRAAIERYLSHQTLQDPNKIASALSLIGVSDFWEAVARELGQDREMLKSNIGKIVKRRNQIAHEGDLSQSKKIRNTSRAISPKYVSDAIKLFRKVAAAADQIIHLPTKKNSKKKKPKKTK